MTRANLRHALLVLALIGLAAGLGSHLLGRPDWSGPVWTAATIPVLVALVAEIILSVRRGDVGLDVVAALSMTGAVAMGQSLAAIVVALMYAGGQYLESYAEGRARRELTSLLGRAPAVAVKHGVGGLEEIPANAAKPGDRLLVRRGDIVPVDGTVVTGTAVIDESALTGEALPVRRGSGEPVLSGSLNAGDAFDMVASASAGQSTYAGIIRLVELAQQAKAPMTRIADRFAIWFLGGTLLIAGSAWFVSSDPLRALAVLVVATPCPLILAVPVAIVSGISRLANLGVLVKGGGALEQLARIAVIVVDKTGTLTYGTARYSSATLASGWKEDEVLRIAASLDQASAHVIAAALVAEARTRSLRLVTPTNVAEVPGKGLEGMVEGGHVVLGGYEFVRSRIGIREQVDLLPLRVAGAVSVAVAVDGALIGVLTFADEIRAGTATLIQRLRKHGIRRVVLATGDQRDVADAVTAGLPIDEVHAELGPEDKVRIVQKERKHGPVMMIGDGVNDAPALASADLGVAMGAAGTKAAAEAADVVLLTDRLDRILSAVSVARRSRRIALQSVYAGLGLSVAGMLVAAAGYLTPVQGALLQEAIDVAVILNALRVLRRTADDGATEKTVQRQARAPWAFPRV